MSIKKKQEKEETNGINRLPKGHAVLDPTGAIWQWGRSRRQGAQDNPLTGTFVRENEESMVKQHDPQLGPP